MNRHELCTSGLTIGYTGSSKRIAMQHASDAASRPSVTRFSLDFPTASTHKTDAESSYEMPGTADCRNESWAIFREIERLEERQRILTARLFALTVGSRAIVRDKVVDTDKACTGLSKVSYLTPPDTSSFVVYFDDKIVVRFDVQRGTWTLREEMKIVSLLHLENEVWSTYGFSLLSIVQDALSQFGQSYVETIGIRSLIDIRDGLCVKCLHIVFDQKHVYYSRQTDASGAPIVKWNSVLMPYYLLTSENIVFSDRTDIPELAKYGKMIELFVRSGLRTAVLANCLGINVHP